jgi:GNAT superfamily N-acetyltransferase
MTARDRRFVVPTWALGSSYDGLSKAARFDLVDEILAAGARCVTLATDERTVHAWACADDDLLHYVYVPPDLRGFGLAKRVITAVLGDYPARINVTHAWPRESSRFRFTPHLRKRIAA